jgi:hypothetical protein
VTNVQDHRAVATDVAIWLAADGIRFGTDQPDDPSAFFIEDSRGAVFVETIGGFVLISCKWLILPHAPDDLRLYQWALRSNADLLVGRVVLDDSGIWFNDLLRSPTTQDEFRFHLGRCIQDVSRLRDELAVIGYGPATDHADGGLTEEERKSITSWAVAFAFRGSNDGPLLPAAVARIGPIPVSTPAARRCAAEYFAKKLRWATTRHERPDVGRSHADNGLLSSIEYWRSVAAWFESTGQGAEDADPVLNDAKVAEPITPHSDGADAASDRANTSHGQRPPEAPDLSAGEGLSEEQRGQVVQWAVTFNSARPPDGCLTTAVIERAGPIPVSGASARAVAHEYFESKLPAAEVRRKHALEAADPASVPEDFFNAPAYWRAVIAWLDGQGGGTPPPPVPARPQWYFRDDVVELDRDIAIDGKPYPEGTTGTVLGVEDDTLVKLARQGRIAVMFPGDDLEVIPIELLRPAGSTSRGPLRSPESCNHAWSRAGYRWGPVDRERRLRPFWSRSVCSACGAERLHDSDEYSGGDMAIVHLKWRGSTW